MTRPAPPHWVLPVLYAGMVLAWGLNFIFVKIGLASSPPLWLAAFRALLGTTGVAIGAAAWRSGPPLSSRERRDALLLGIPMTGLFFGLWFSAAVQVPPGQTAVLIYTFPLWVVVLSFVLLRDRTPAIAWISIIIGFLGVIFIEQPWTGSSGHLPGPAVAELLAAAACWALGTVLLKSRISGPGLRTANTYQLLGGTAVILAAALIFEPHPQISVTPDLVASLLWLGLIGTSLANVVWFVLLERFPAATVSTWAFLTPVVALGASVAIFGEALNAIQITGVAAVLAGAFVIARTSGSGSSSSALARQNGRRFSGGKPPGATPGTMGAGASAIEPRTGEANGPGRPAASPSTSEREL